MDAKQYAVLVASVWEMVKYELAISSDITKCVLHMKIQAQIRVPPYDSSLINNNHKN